ncbi:MAG: DISARM system phospholipase D-like protein DrmC [Tepidisphaeraceae bacterium]|jgi:phosphatidylserine/phosphatidylglycerophosphate/cardiolipin synthase-like enzyme
MNDALLKLATADLGELADALLGNRLSPPFSAITLQRLLPSAIAEAAAVALQQLADEGLGARQIAVILQLLRDDRLRRPLVEDLVTLVTTGPEAVGVTNRDTSVVVRELFSHARHSVMVAGYAIHQGQHVFQSLADRMQERPELEVRMFLDIQRGPGDRSSESELVRRFAGRFQKHQWPKDRPLPWVYYYPRALDLAADARSCLHAKCIVVDAEAAFVSSANFTEAAQERNIEVGMLIRSATLAERLALHFKALVDCGCLNQIMFLGHD